MAKRDPKKLAEQDAAEVVAEEVARSIPGQSSEVQTLSPYDAVAISRGPMIHTLDQLLEFCQVDLNVWAVSDYKVNKWEVGARIKHKNNTGIGVTPLFQVKANLVRKAPIAIKPVRPANIKRVKEKKERPVGTAVFIPDTQHGYKWTPRYEGLIALHDNRAIDAAIQFCKRVQPDVIVMLGDHMDLAPWSLKYRTDPLFRQTTQPTIDALYWHLTQIRLACPKARIVWMKGNHEERVDIALDAALPEARHLKAAGSGDRLMSLRNLLQLSSLDIETVEPYGADWWLWRDETDRPVHINHGMTHTSAGSTAGKKAQKQVYSKVFGHIHRRELASRTIHGPNGVYEVFSMSPGCLCRIDGDVPSVNPRNNWQQGVGLAHFDGDVIHPELYGIQNGRLSYGGVVLVGEDTTAQIAKDTGWQQMNHEAST